MTPTATRRKRSTSDELTASLRNVIAAEPPTDYGRTRSHLTRKHGETAVANALPTTCPYSLDQSVGDWLP